MTVTPGTRLGAYEILTLLGSGGMGEVYRARDTKLGRDVAIKVLPELFAADPDRLARFKREAQLLASLNHPNIGAIYGFEDAGGVQALVLELVEGPTLADRIAPGAIPLDEALPIARQIAEALEVAHEQGIIHRDLKPANIQVRADGAVKVLDFGLAKALEPASASGGDVTASPTITSLASPAMTRMGVILGTAAFMSPEQAKGRPADKRSDVWAFGWVLHEMLTGKRAFEGDDVADTLAAVLKGEPQWSALPTNTPSAIRTLLRRCLEKEIKRRLGEIASARLEIDDTLTAPSADSTLDPSTVAGSRAGETRGRLWATGVALVTVSACLAALITWTVAHHADPIEKVQAVRFAIAAPQLLAPSTSAGQLAISPDGTRVVYVIGQGRLMIRAIDELEAAPLPGVTDARAPFWSPDGKWIGFFQGASALKKVCQPTPFPGEQVQRQVFPRDGRPSVVITIGRYHDFPWPLAPEI